MSIPPQWAQMVVHMQMILQLLYNWSSLKQKPNQDVVSLRALQSQERLDDCGWTGGGVGGLTNEMPFAHEFLQWFTFWQTGQSSRWSPWLLDEHSVLSPPAGSSSLCYSTAKPGFAHAGERKARKNSVSRCTTCSHPDVGPLQRTDSI